MVTSNGVVTLNTFVVGFKDNPSDLTMVDPSGGPYIANEMDMGEFGFDGKIVNGFISNENGYEIVIKK